MKEWVYKAHCYIVNTAFAYCTINVLRLSAIAMAEQHKHLKHEKDISSTILPVHVKDVCMTTQGSLRC